MTKVHMTDVTEGKKMAEKLPEVTFYTKKERRYEDTCWYTLSLVTAIVCCVPCGVVGLMNAMMAKQEAMRDNEAGYRNRVRNAKLCTTMAVFIALIVIASVAMLSFLFASTLVNSDKLNSKVNSIMRGQRIGDYQYDRGYDYGDYSYVDGVGAVRYSEYNPSLLSRLSNLIKQQIQNEMNTRQQTTPEPYWRRTSESYWTTARQYWTTTRTTKLPYWRTPSNTTELNDIEGSSNFNETTPITITDYDY